MIARLAVVVVVISIVTATATRAAAAAATTTTTKAAHSSGCDSILRNRHAVLFNKIAKTSSHSRVLLLFVKTHNFPMKRSSARNVVKHNLAQDDDNDDNSHTRKRRSTTTNSMVQTGQQPNTNQSIVMPPSASSSFRATKAKEAQSLTDGVALRSGWFMGESASVAATSTTIILPWVGFGTYRLGQKQAYTATLEALKCGYRCIDTAFIYGGETTELEVGKALQTALQEDILSDRSQVCIITKQWRKYHGYDETWKCLELSLKRLQVEYIDLYLIHWPGPGWTTPFRRNDELEKHGPWHYANVTPEEMVHLRAETWRAMEDAVQAGKIKAIGVSNFTIRQLETLRKTARLWPPAVNQVECHPLYPQSELRTYCEDQGIVVQAYAALGGQDATKAQWKLLLEGEATDGSKGKKLPRNLMTAKTVLSLAQELDVTPAQVLLRYALERHCAITPKASSQEHMVENANIFSFSLTPEQMANLDQLYTKNAALLKDPSQGRLCWRSEPLRLLDFD
jgi:diketogulonate reductase-like aldo/keto reductase